MIAERYRLSKTCGNPYSPPAVVERLPLRVGYDRSNVLRVYIFDCIFGAFFNAGLRIYDTSNPFQPKEVAYFVPQVPSTARANSVNDVYVDENRIIYAVDRLMLFQTRSTKSSSPLEFHAPSNIEPKADFDPLVLSSH
jgi:hypothetical protein